MNHKKQWNTFFAVEKAIPYDGHMLETMELAHCIRQTTPNRCRISFGSMIAKQFKFIALKIWFLQGMVLALLCALFFRLYDISILLGTDDINWIQRSVSRFLCLCGCVVVISTIPLLQRATRYQMMELEQSTYFSIRGNLLAQLLFIGIGDLGMLTALALLAGRFQVTGRTIFLSLIIPYLTASVSCLMLWTRTTPSFFHKASTCVCILSAYLIYEIAYSSRIMLANTTLYVWVLYALVCTGILCLKYRKLFLEGTIEKKLL